MARAIKNLEALQAVERALVAVTTSTEMISVYLFGSYSVGKAHRECHEPRTGA